MSCVSGPSSAQHPQNTHRVRNMQCTTPAPHSTPIHQYGAKLSHVGGTRVQFGSHCSGHISCGFVYPGYTFIPPAHEAITATPPSCPHECALCTRGTHSFPSHPNTTTQPKSNNALRDNLPSLCLEGLLTRRGAHRGGSTRTRLLFTVFNRHFSDPYRFIACRENPLSR